MSDMLAIILVLVLLVCAYPALLSTIRVLFPRPVASNQARIERQPWRCFWTGLLAAVAIALPAIILINLPLGLLKFMGWSLMGLGLGLSVFGAAGLAGLMASRIQAASPGTPAEFGAFVRAGVMIELAAIFPLLVAIHSLYSESDQRPRRTTFPRPQQPTPRPALRFGPRPPSAPM